MAFRTGFLVRVVWKVGEIVGSGKAQEYLRPAGGPERWLYERTWQLFSLEPVRDARKDSRESPEGLG